MPNYTKAQQLAIQHNKGNVLVSAGAGSGKTMVLTQRVLRMVLDDGVPLEQLLILTFTNAAANAMKEKIRKAFLDRHDHDAAARVDQAYIMTFDAFALFLVKKYHTVLNVDADVGVYEETLYEVEKRTTLEKLFEEGYAAKDPAFIELIKQYVINSDHALKEFILKIDRKADLKPDKEAYYKTYLDEHFKPSTYASERSGQLFSQYRHEIELIKRQATLFKSSSETEFFHNLCDELIHLPTLDDLLTRLKLLEFPRLKPKSLEKPDIALRKKLKEDLQSFKVLADMLPIETQLQRYEDTKPFVERLLILLLQLNQCLNEVKNSLQRYPFADIAKMATSLFRDENLRQTLKHQFAYIMVDEYQDTNDLQENFLQHLAQDNLFMVGDIKQSIYRFRNANSQLFADKLNQFTPYEQSTNGYDTVIHLNHNFRSRKEVLGDINDVFSFVMTPAFGGVHYDHHQQLTYGQTLYDQHKDARMDYHLEVLRYLKVDEDKDKHEPRLIARNIKEKIIKGIQVLDDHTQALRPITFKDFAILIDRKTNFESYLTVFNEEGIPLDVFAERDLSDSDFFRVIKNLIGFLVFVKTPSDLETYRQLYVSLLRSFLFGLKDEAIYQLVFKKTSFESTELFKIHQFFHPLKDTLPLSQWLHQLFQALAVERKLLTLPDLPSNLARLEGLITRVQQLTAMGFTVDRFYQFLQDSHAIDVDLTITAQKESDNAVQLMTIHKSKGLEFPFVYYPGLTKGFNMMETKGMYHMSLKYGIQLPYPEAVYAKPIFADLILNEEAEAILSEQVRLFYVALTRAKEKIILIFESSQEKKLIDMDRARSFSDFIHLYYLARSKDPLQDQYVDPSLPMVHLPHVRQVDLTEPLKFLSIAQPFTTTSPRRASKPLTESVDDSILEYGTYLHECMFLMDFATLNLDFIPNPNDRNLMQTLIKHPFFTNLQSQVKTKVVTIQKEYGFYDEVRQRKGIIDLLILEGNQATIVDYKTKAIDDPLYEQQLQAYASWLVDKGLIIKEKILISLTESKLKVIKP